MQHSLGDQVNVNLRVRTSSQARRLPRTSGLVSTSGNEEKAGGLFRAGCPFSVVPAGPSLLPTRHYHHDSPCPVDGRSPGWSPNVAQPSHAGLGAVADGWREGGLAERRRGGDGAAGKPEHGRP